MAESRIAGLVLAGGEGRRLSPDKGWREVQGVPIISRVLAAVASVADETFVVGSATLPPDAQVRVVPDEMPGAGPLAAIYTGMKAISADYYLVVAWDMPFLTAGLLRYLVAACGGFDALVPVVGGREQPLCAVYARSCLRAISDALAQGCRRVADFYPRVHLWRLAEEEVAHFGRPEVLFFNVNTPEDLELARRMAASSGEGARKGIGAD